MKGQDVILGLLMKKSLSGYEIRDFIENRLSHFFDSSFGMIYPTLKKLEQNNLVTKKTILQNDRPNKNIFSITQKGKDSFLASLQNEPKPDQLKSDYLIHFYFGEYLDKEALYVLTQKQIKQVKEKLSSLNYNLKHWQESGMTEEQKMTYDYGIKFYTGSLEILENEAEKLEKNLS
ncbi:PadR family transcriptional regulator [Fructobacillus tropaeoli]|uniref:PadR family (PadR) n=1 Tax=Fructobacillus tropaeoli TaxID=709323 RepID=A0A3F3H8A2_9LACO|nr:PadR family transcriptional regulator [Fructobacillus tropaeoli]GAP03780.1 transcriptional regulator, PadR family [Fructobacillus tropaeoli]CAK1230049.1 DNA-binding transcriptional regulator [Fructobacillus tropaeoli]CAK1231384.1 DNA-binding transcriptional regulator [Fructobacillus tropaeoli]